MPLPNILLNNSNYPQRGKQFKLFSIILDISRVSQVHADTPKQSMWYAVGLQTAHPGSFQTCWHSFGHHPTTPLHYQRQCTQMSFSLHLSSPLHLSHLHLLLTPCRLAFFEDAVFTTTLSLSLAFSVTASANWF